MQNYSEIISANLSGGDNSSSSVGGFLKDGSSDGLYQAVISILSLGILGLLLAMLKRVKTKCNLFIDRTLDNVLDLEETSHQITVTESATQTTTSPSTDTLVGKLVQETTVSPLPQEEVDVPLLSATIPSSLPATIITTPSKKLTRSPRIDFTDSSSSTLCASQAESIGSSLEELTRDTDFDAISV